MEKEIRDMTETRTAHYLKYLCEHGKYKYQCRECKGSQICLITSGNLNAKSAEGLKYALIAECEGSQKITARSAVIRLK